MEDIQTHFVEKLLAHARTGAKEAGAAFAPANIALCKYWGKRCAALNLPVNSSLSVSLGSLGTRTEIRPRGGGEPSDLVELDGRIQPPDSSFARRVSAFLGLFRPLFGGAFFEVRTANTIPTAAGLASSASGFAALALALDDLAGWGLDRKALSMIARLGSGSAARSVHDGFVQWHAGSLDDGTDSYAEPLPDRWEGFRIGILGVSEAPKPVGSRDGMARTVQTSVLYDSWPRQAGADLATLRAAIAARDFPLLGKTAERNALAMHATMLAAWPPLLYLLPETVAQIHRVQRLRADGLEAYLTIDAGPNLKLLFLESSESAVAGAFPGLQTVKPFG